MSNRDRLLSDLRNLEYDRLAIQMMHDDISSISADLGPDIDGHKDSHNPDINSLLERRHRLMLSLKVTVNHVGSLERLLGMLSPEEQLVINSMLVNPYKNCIFDLMESLHLEKSQIYNIRAGAIKKLLRLRYGAGAGE